MRRADLHGLWRRVHGAESLPPDVLDLHDYGDPSRVLRDCWRAWHDLAEHVAALPPPGGEQNTTDAAGPRAGHLTTTGEGSALPIDREDAR